jgi:DNA-binding transcriptional ArsR family regulator
VAPGLDGEAPDPLEILMAGLETVWRVEEGMVMSCLRTFLAVCAETEREGQGITLRDLARQLETHRSNASRHLKFLRERGFVGSIANSSDGRSEINLPTEKGWQLYDTLRKWPR